MRGSFVENDSPGILLTAPISLEQSPTQAGVETPCFFQSAPLTPLPSPYRPPCQSHRARLQKSYAILNGRNNLSFVVLLSRGVNTSTRAETSKTASILQHENANGALENCQILCGVKVSLHDHTWLFRCHYSARHVSKWVHRVFIVRPPPPSLSFACFTVWFCISVFWCFFTHKLSREGC